MDKEKNKIKPNSENVNEMLYTCPCGSHRLQLLSTRTDTKNRKYNILLACLQCGLFQHVDLSIDSPLKNPSDTVIDQVKKKDNYIG